VAPQEEFGFMELATLPENYILFLIPLPGNVYVILKY
jgi:hypothetical protein